jgi:hypothetical protein
MGEAGRDSTAAYNYPRFDEYVAAGGDRADEDAFRASPWRGSGHRTSRCRGSVTARESGYQTCGGPGRW